MRRDDPHLEGVATRARIARALGWAGVVALLAGTWRAFPRPAAAAPSLPALRAVVLDASAGTVRRRSGWGLWARGIVREEALAAREAGEELAVVLYGADRVRLRGDPRPAAWLDRLEGAGGGTLRLSLEGRAALGSELDGAVGLVEGDLLDPARPRGDVLLAAEAGYTGPDPALRLARLEREGVRVRRVPPPPASWPDLALEGAHLPRRPEVGAPLAVRFDLALDPGGAGRAALEERGSLTLEVAIDGPGVSETRRLPLAFPRGPAGADGYVRWSVRAELGATRDGRGRLTARARLTAPGALRGGDPIPENDVRSRSWRAGDARVAAAVARSESLPGLRAWLGGEGRWPGLQWIVTEPHELGSLARDVDLLLSFDLSPRELPAAQLSALLDRGGGWFFCGGWGLLAPWGARGGRSSTDDPAAWLPLRPAEDEREERDVLFLVDGSGSMAGEPFERVKAALAELVAIVPESDALSLRFFTGTLGRGVDLDARDGGGRGVLRRLLATKVPGGTTAILYSLERLVEVRQGSDREALVILLSDGRDHNAFDVERRGAEIRRGLGAARARLRVLAVGDDADLGLLSALLGPGETPVRAEDLSGLDDLFRREVLGDRVRQGRFEVALAADGALRATGELLPAWIGLGAPLPAVESYLGCELVPGADLLWQDDGSGEPLLALGRAGSGLVAAWPTAPLEGWAPGFARADEALAPLLRTLARGARRPSAPELEVVGGDLVLHGVPPGWPARIRARFFAYVPGAPEVRELLEEEVATALLLPPARPPGLDPRAERRGSLPPELDRQPPGAPLRVELVGRGGAPLAQVDAEVPPPAELVPGGARLGPGPWSTVRPAAPRLSGARATEADPRAWLWVLGGCALLFAGALLGGLEGAARSGRGPRAVDQ